MERHEKGEARVIPVILKPSYWKGLPFSKLLATPTDGKPVTKFPTLDEAFLEVTEAIADAAEELGTITKNRKQVLPKIQSDPTTIGGAATAAQSSSKQDIRSNNLRVKKEFSDHAKDQFTDESYKFIANYFENTLDELKRRTPEVSSRFNRINSNHFSAAVYVNGHYKSGCRIWIGDRFISKAIAYSTFHRK